MTAEKHSDTPSFHELLIPQQPQPPQYVIVLPPYRRPRRNRIPGLCHNIRLISISAALLLLISAAYLLWPSDPELSISRLRLDGLHFHATPSVSIDVNLDLTVKVRNVDFYSIDYDKLFVAIAYRGERLGSMTSAGGRVRARGTSYVDAALRLDGVEILSDAILLIEDLVKGAIEFETVSAISGKLGLFFFSVPIKTKISCEVIVNTRNETITHQSCYPKV